MPQFLKTAGRNIRRHKAFTFINIVGLTLGLTACLLITLFVRDEQQYDKFVPGGSDMYRVYQVSEVDKTNIIATAPPAFATALKQNYPEVEQTLRVIAFNSRELFEADNKKIYQDKGFAADSTFFEMFPLHFRYGSPVKALDAPNSIVLSASMAESFFGNSDPVGKEITFAKETFRISGVLETNEKFHLPLKYIISFAGCGINAKTLDNWQWYPFFTYVKLKPGTEAQALESKFQAYSKPFLKGDGPSNIPLFQPLHDIHLQSSDFKYDAAIRGNISYVRALTIIALFILMIACFNFVNLTTSRSLQRAKEVGVRKAIGAGKRQLVLQFMGETFVFASLSLLLAIGSTALLLPALNAFTEKNIPLNILIDPIFLGISLLLVLVTGVLAGFYPALLLSAFNPVKVLKGGASGNITAGKTPWLRHSLVVVQFSLSVLMIISAIVVVRQVDYMHNKDLGFRKDQVLFFPMRGDGFSKNYEAFRNELVQYAGIKTVSVGYGFPGDMFGDGMMTVKEKPGQEAKRATQLMVDHEYIKTIGLELVAGRDFSKDIVTDERGWIINETAVREFELGTPAEALGKTLSWPTWRKPDSFKTGPIIGVVKDFNYKSLHEKVEPAVLQIYPAAYSKVAVRLQGDDIDKSVAYVKSIWNRYSPDYPMEYSFLDESFTKMYKAEDKLKTLLTIFTAVTIVVACMGLFGLAAFGAERRRKELGVRKVLGATTQGLVLLLSKEFMKLVVVSVIIASPIAWYFMNGWLDKFAYRIDISWWMFAAAGLLAIILAFLTTSFQAIKAANSNPVQSLRME